MALVPVPSFQWPPSPPLKATVTPAYGTTIILDAASEKFGAIFCPPKTGNIRKIHFRTGTVTVGGAGPASKDVRIETIDAATGQPSGTLWGTNTNVSIGIDAADDDVWKTTAALTADAVITDIRVPIGVVISNPATDPGNWVVATIGSALNQSSRPYVSHFTTGWSKQALLLPVLAVEYSDGSIPKITGVWPVSQFSDHAMDVAMTPDEVGIIFRVPFRTRLSGFWMFNRNFNSLADLEIVFYDAAGTETFTKTLDATIYGGLTAHLIEEDFSGTHIIEPNTWYRLTVRPLTANDNFIAYMECASVALMNAMPGGADVYWTERTDGGAWTDNTTKVPMIGARFDQLSDDVQAGGSGGAHWIGG